MTDENFTDAANQFSQSHHGNFKAVMAAVEAVRTDFADHYSADKVDSTHRSELGARSTNRDAALRKLFGDKLFKPELIADTWQRNSAEAFNNLFAGSNDTSLASHRTPEVSVGAVFNAISRLGHGITPNQADRDVIAQAPQILEATKAVLDNADGEHGELTGILKLETMRNKLPAAVDALAAITQGLKDELGGTEQNPLQGVTDAVSKMPPSMSERHMPKNEGKSGGMGRG